MASKSYSKRYARAVFEIALEQNELEKWQSELGRLIDLEKDPDVALLLDSQKLSFDDKVKVVDARLSDVGQMARNLAYLLVSGNKMGLINDIAVQYRSLLNSHFNTEYAEVTTAVALDESVKEKIRTTLGSIIGKQIVMQTRVDPAIIGGIVARIDGKLLDGSTRGRLETLKNRLVGEENSK